MKNIDPATQTILIGFILYLAVVLWRLRKWPGGTIWVEQAGEPMMQPLNLDDERMWWVSFILPEQQIIWRAVRVSRQSGRKQYVRLSVVGLPSGKLYASFGPQAVEFDERGDRCQMVPVEGSPGYVICYEPPALPR